MELPKNIFESAVLCHIWCVFVSKFNISKGEKIDKHTCALITQPGFLQ